jgi:hypothetical protein
MRVAIVKADTDGKVEDRALEVKELHSLLPDDKALTIAHTCFSTSGVAKISYLLEDNTGSRLRTWQEWSPAAPEMTLLECHRPTSVDKAASA